MPDPVMADIRMTEITYGSALAIEGYGPGFFRVGRHVLRGACLVTPWNAGPWGGLGDWDAPLSLQGKIDVLIVGTGAEIAHLPADFRAAFGEDAPPVSGVAIATDTDNTGETARAWFGDLELR
jgi:uncharacterized protein